ncbi:hypothetical protein [Tahibacter sp.]|uniref:hypothetical protein n=1 Tax=Tahibacter sp. TaxID=2056211 RepID=UPI0028C4BAC0|nr:hypothetical protein [Tahibacter sp.]
MWLPQYGAIRTDELQASPNGSGELQRVIVLPDRPTEEAAVTLRQGFGCGQALRATESTCGRGGHTLIASTDLPALVVDQGAHLLIDGDDLMAMVKVSG